jgi:hypothetical protein
VVEEHGFSRALRSAKMRGFSPGSKDFASAEEKRQPVDGMDQQPRHEVGDNTVGVTPVPIPNTEVKPHWADCTARAGVWESR